MEVVKQNQFWFSVGGVLLLIVAVAGFFVAGLKSDAATLENQIRSAGTTLTEASSKGAELPNAEWAKSMQDNYTQLSATRDEIKNYLVNEGGKTLNKWFTAEKPSLDQFKPVYLLKTDELKQSLESKNVRIGPKKGTSRPSMGQEGEENGFERVAEPTVEQMPKLMKHYWVQKRLVSVLADSGVIALLSVRFKDSPARVDNSQIPGGGGQPVVVQPVEQGQLPLGLGVLLEFDVVIECYYPEISKVLHNFLLVDKELPIFTRIKKVDIKKTSTPPERKEVKVPADEIDDPKWQNLQPDRVPVRLTLTGEVLDFAPMAAPAK